MREWSPRWLSSPFGGDFDFDYEEFETLHEVAEELVEQAVRRRLPPVVGEVALEPYLPLVERDPPASLLLVGPSGVGKTTWIRALARLFALGVTIVACQPGSQDTPPALTVEFAGCHEFVPQRTCVLKPDRQLTVWARTDPDGHLLRILC